MELNACTRCVLDTSVEDIHFDAQGVCNYCHEYDKLAAQTVLRPKEVITKELEELLASIKKQGEKQEYDCIIGLSGGVDSSYLCLLAKQFGLRPLVVHFDNGWNSELAVKNIENIVTRLGFDLHTFVVDWNEFRSLQVAFLKASVIDIELPTDHAMLATLYKLALKNKIRYILSGHNVVSESVLPVNWYFNKRDHIH